MDFQPFTNWMKAVEKMVVHENSIVYAINEEEWSSHEVSHPLLTFSDMPAHASTCHKQPTLRYLVDLVVIVVAITVII